MKQENKNFNSTIDGLNISYLVTIPENEPIAILQIAHGMLEPKERFLHMMEYFTEKGFICVINDHRGHGESVLSSKDLGYFYQGGYKGMVEDMHTLTTIIKKDYPDKKLFIYGHSMGSMVSRCYMKNYDADIDAIILNGSASYNPLLNGGLLLTRTMKLFRGEHHCSPFINKLIFGGFNQKASSSANGWICSDPKVVAAYDVNPKCNFTFTLNGFENLMLLMKETYSIEGWHVDNPELPIIFTSGADDPCYGGEKKFHQTVSKIKDVGYKKVSYKLFPKMLHETHNEIGKEEFFEYILDFLKRAL